ncbi:hypothetical protein T310_7833 [Rasamsonia emersonii CBS 393.64]|uniref:Uncharacterized protein n=1 Tax=Rasamsonia emersonii (strain ATCC 16479 / CBS 393.64 / IMI 116815) TaxID=1408163 RepID=A0A0F4YKW4_RASE3|nr:hypothetical protein T310_7833 [Rasamsonia emersonii CBS 393.64]KKA18223.1 hypothetical protein T310_7833 [Rasamsonia emersonii CBS 393.64]
MFDGRQIDPVCGVPDQPQCRGYTPQMGALGLTLAWHRLQVVSSFLLGNFFRVIVVPPKRSIGSSLQLSSYVQIGLESLACPLKLQDSQSQIRGELNNGAVRIKSSLQILGNVGGKLLSDKFGFWLPHDVKISEFGKPSGCRYFQLSKLWNYRLHRLYLHIFPTTRSNSVFHSMTGFSDKGQLAASSRKEPDQRLGRSCQHIYMLKSRRLP